MSSVDTDKTINGLSRLEFLFFRTFFLLSSEQTLLEFDRRDEKSIIAYWVARKTSGGTFSIEYIVRVKHSTDAWKFLSIFAHQ